MRRLAVIVLALLGLVPATAHAADGHVLVASAGSARLTAWTEHGQLCLQLDRSDQSSFGSCSDVPLSPFEPVLIGGVAGAVPADVAAVELETPGGPVRLDTVSATGLSGRFFLAPGEPDVTLLRFYDAAGTLLGAA